MGFSLAGLHAGMVVPDPPAICAKWADFSQRSQSLHEFLKGDPKPPQGSERAKIEGKMDREVNQDHSVGRASGNL